MTITNRTTPPLQTSLWLNAPQPVTLDSLRGHVVVLHAFQMLCPGCVSHGLPQALRIHRLFPQEIAMHQFAIPDQVIQKEKLFRYLHYQ